MITNVEVFHVTCDQCYVIIQLECCMSISVYLIFKSHLYVCKRVHTLLEEGNNFLTIKSAYYYLIFLYDRVVLYSLNWKHR